MGTLKQIAIGAAGGLAGAVLMGIVHARVAELVPKRPSQGEDATENVANALTKTFAGQRLGRSKRKIGGQVVHLTFGAGVGALYALLASRFPAIRAGQGALFGLSIYLGAHSVAVPAMGLAESPIRNGLVRETPELAGHVAYGLVTDGVRRVLS